MTLKSSISTIMLTFSSGKIKNLLFVACALYPASVFAQAKEEKLSASKSQALSFGISVPVGDFAATHFGGLTVEYSWSKKPFGPIREIVTKQFGFIVTGGVTYYFGEKEKVSGYPYDYPGYIFIHAFGGVLYNPVKSGSVSLTAGPALGIYNGNTRFNFGSKLEASYYISKNIGIGPGIILMKEPGATSLWAASFKATLNL